MKKLTKKEFILKESIIFNGFGLQRTLNINFIKLNLIINRQIKDKKYRSFNNLKFNNHERTKQS